MGSRVVAGECILGLEEAKHEDIEGRGPTGVVNPGGEDEFCGLALWGHDEDHDHDRRCPEHMPPHYQKSKERQKRVRNEIPVRENNSADSWIKGVGFHSFLSLFSPLNPVL